MADVTGILCQVITGDVNGAGTDGRIYLGIGAREFRLDSTRDDFERNSWREYILGLAPLEPNLPPPQTRVNNPNRNDPRVGFALDTVDLDRAPVYIRFEPTSGSDNWNLSFAAALVYTGAGNFFAGYFPPNGFDNLWLGNVTGKILYLTDSFRDSDQTILDRGRKIAATAGIKAE